MPIMTWYPNHLKPLFANRDLFKRALCRRSFLIIVGTYLHRALQHNQAVNLTSVVPVPGPNRSGIAERQVRLSNLIIPHHILPIFSHDFREKSSFVDQLVNFMNTHTRQHDKTLLSDEYEKELAIVTNTGPDIKPLSSYDISNIQKVRTGAASYYHM